MKYEIIFLADVPASKVSLVSNCYQVWKDVYTPILKEAGEVLSADFFYRSKMLSVIHDGNHKPIAFSLLNNMHTEILGVIEQTYFEPAPSDFKALLIGEKEQVMTIEWVTVHPDERGKFTKIQPVDLVMGLTFRLAQFSPYTSVMGFSRVDMKADRIAGRYGPRPYGEVTRHNITCKVMFAKTSELVSHPLSQVQALIDELWNSKENHSPLVKDAKIYQLPNKIKQAG